MFTGVTFSDVSGSVVLILTGGRMAERRTVHRGADGGSILHAAVS